MNHEIKSNKERKPRKPKRKLLQRLFEIYLCRCLFELLQRFLEITNNILPKRKLPYKNSHQQKKYLLNPLCQR